LIGFQAYQQALEEEKKEADQALPESMQPQEKEQSEVNQTLIDLQKEPEPEQPQVIQKVAESNPEQPQKIKGKSSFFDCTGSAGCFTEHVTRVVDGDTIYTGNYKVRLSLTNTPEINQTGYLQATIFTQNLCPIGSSILVDQDDLQPVDEYGRVLAKVYCGNKVLNSELLNHGYANIIPKYCATSEFTAESWAQEYGCGIKKIPSQITTPSQKIENNCDQSYPSVCIPSPPPDLDCSDIIYRKFMVLQPDPHMFDGDKDGIGCE